MADLGREYVSRRPVASRADGQALCDQLAARLRPMLDQGFLRGFLARVLYTVDDIEDEDLDFKHILGHAGAQLPILWLALTFPDAPTTRDQLAATEAELDLLLLQEYPA